MSERARWLTLYGAMLVLQAVVAWAIFVSSWCMRKNWSELLAGAALPRGTVLAFNLAYAIPAVAATACFAVLSGLLRRRPIHTAGWFAAIAMAEIVALALYAVGITEPALFITYRMGP